MAVIYHLTDMITWSEALEKGLYRVASLETEGFIHCSTAEQVMDIANGIYRNRPELIMLQIETDLLESRVVYENLEGGSRMFPHIYGPLPVAAVLDVIELSKGNDGLFARPDEL